MRPKREPEQPQRELFQIDLEQLIDNEPSTGFVWVMASIGRRLRRLWAAPIIPVKVRLASRRG